MTTRINVGDTLIDRGGPSVVKTKVISIERGVATLGTGVTIEQAWIEARIGTDIEVVASSRDGRAS